MLDRELTRTGSTLSSKLSSRSSALSSKLSTRSSAPRCGSPLSVRHWHVQGVWGSWLLPGYCLHAA